MRFNENWTFSPTVEYQQERPENFAWAKNGVLFLGLDLIGGAVHEQAEWDERLADDALWVESQFEQRKDSIGATVLFGHADMTEIGPDKSTPFTDRFKASAKIPASPFYIYRARAIFGRRIGLGLRRTFYAY